MSHLFCDVVKMFIEKNKIICQLYIILVMKDLSNMPSITNTKMYYIFNVFFILYGRVLTLKKVNKVVGILPRTCLLKYISTVLTMSTGHPSQNQ